MDTIAQKKNYITDYIDVSFSSMFELQCWFTELKLDYTDEKYIP